MAQGIDPGSEAAREHIPARSYLLGYGPMMPFVAAAIGVWTMPQPWPLIATRLALAWGVTILVFVAGVRRGTSFYTPGGPSPAELASALTIFAIGFVALLLPPNWALGLLALGYVIDSVVDALAGRSALAPRYFATLRPTQMSIAVVSLSAILAYQLR